MFYKIVQKVILIVLWSSDEYVYKGRHTKVVSLSEDLFYRRQNK